MKFTQGFTIVELMIVIIVIGILSAVAIPIMQGRIDSAKWAEGKAYMGIIARALRAHICETGGNFTTIPTLKQLGFAGNDLKGNYFSGGESGAGDFSWVIYNNDPMDFLITATAPDSINSPSKITLDHTGTFIEIP
jgi:prepilin-type N-terminal cleavage/methylation domain-containing protein